MIQKEKIKTVDELATISKELRERQHKVVLCHGCFDLLHIGHIRYLKQARQMGGDPATWSFVQ